MKVAICMQAALLCVVAFVLPCPAAEMSEVGPQVSARQLIVAHGTDTVPILRITYRQSENGKAAVTRRADIAPDFVWAETNGGTILLDYKLRRQISIDPKAHAFTNLSLFMMPDFRYIESYNRRMERQMLKKVGISNPPPDLVNSFWNQQELGIAGPDDEPPAFEKSEIPGGGMKFVADGETAASFTSSANALSADEMKGFAHFLRETAYLHPSVTDAIITSGHVPGRLSFMRMLGGKKTSYEWTLVSAERVTGSYPLPPDYSPQILQPGESQGDAAVLQGLMPLMLDAVAGRANGGPRPPQSYRADTADALAKGNILQSYTTDNEFLLQYRQGILACASHQTNDGCENAADAIAKWKADASTSKLIQSFYAENSGDIKQAIATRQELDRHGLSNGYMLDLWIGDALTEEGETGQAIPLLANAVRGDPYVGGFYKDLGDAYNREFDPVDSWLCYDLARALPGGSTAPVVDEIGKKEAYLLAHFPESF